MSRVRVSNTEWRDDGPDRPYSSSFRAYAAVPVEVVGHMKPLLQGAQSDEWREQMREASKRWRDKRRET